MTEKQSKILELTKGLCQSSNQEEIAYKILSLIGISPEVEIYSIPLHWNNSVAIFFAVDESDPFHFIVETGENSGMFYLDIACNCDGKGELIYLFRERCNID